ncbi:MAG: hypothetical protein MR510_00385 [Clostridium sp.]|uniref:hypothetical protein n=1 Tax=Clostridium sp. TaxID=1506 RepID=UPI002A838554|nr:hypothetical protein [Clostridium sp.]MCI6690935.1 hypothetical protein [Clostridium sp.]MDY4252842.1 hypothetical protein [Clostridium sp.]
MRSIKITDLKYDNYNIEVFINDKNVYKPQGYTKEINIKNIIYNENDDIKIVIKHFAYNSSFESFLYFFFYWIAALFGAHDTIEEALPIKRYLKLRSNEDLYIKCFDFKEEKPFQVSGYSSIEENKYITEKKDFFKWISFIIIPIELLLLGIISLFIFLLKEEIIITLILVIIFCVIQGFIFKPIRLVKKYI